MGEVPRNHASLDRKRVFVNPGDLLIFLASISEKSFPIFTCDEIGLLIPYWEFKCNARRMQDASAGKMQAAVKCELL